MGNKNKKNEELSEVIEYLRTLISFNKSSIVGLVISLPLLFIGMYFFNLAISPGLLITLLVFTLTISVYVYLLSKKVHKLGEMENIVMGYLIANVILYTLIVHYIGGIEGIGIIIFTFIIIEANILLSRKKALFIILLSIIFYSALGFLEYFEVIPHHEFFLTGPKSYNNFYYLLFVISFGAILGFYYSGLLASTFSNINRRISDTLNKERMELIKTQSQLKETKDTLEIRVGARTKELEELTKNLEGEVGQRTKELQEKVEELEKFQKFTVGRELKMTELKEKIKNLEKKGEKE